MKRTLITTVLSISLAAGFGISDLSAGDLERIAEAAQNGTAHAVDAGNDFAMVIGRGRGGGGFRRGGGGARRGASGHRSGGTRKASAGRSSASRSKGTHRTNSSKHASKGRSSSKNSHASKGSKGKNSHASKSGKGKNSQAKSGKNSNKGKGKNSQAKSRKNSSKAKGKNSQAKNSNKNNKGNKSNHGGHHHGHDGNGWDGGGWDGGADGDGAVVPVDVDPYIPVTPVVVDPRPAIITLLNPARTQATLSYSLGESEYSIAAGETATCEDGTQVIAFDRGESFGEARYTLEAGGTYQFVSTDHGWDLRSVTADTDSVAGETATADTNEPSAAGALSMVSGN
jgi:hypothetical protein